MVLLADDADSSEAVCSLCGTWVVYVDMGLVNVLEWGKGIGFCIESMIYSVGYALHLFIHF